MGHRIVFMIAMDIGPCEEGCFTAIADIYDCLERRDATPCPIHVLRSGNATLREEADIAWLTMAKVSSGGRFGDTSRIAE
jgi:hypothetical protein